MPESMERSVRIVESKPPKVFSKVPNPEQFASPIAGFPESGIFHKIAFGAPIDVGPSFTPTLQIMLKRRAETHPRTKLAMIKLVQRFVSKGSTQLSDGVHFDEGDAMMTSSSDPTEFIVMPFELPKESSSTELRDELLQEQAEAKLKTDPSVLWVPKPFEIIEFPLETAHRSPQVSKDGVRTLVYVEYR